MVSGSRHLLAHGVRCGGVLRGSGIQYCSDRRTHGAVVPDGTPLVMAYGTFVRVQEGVQSGHGRGDGRRIGGGDFGEQSQGRGSWRRRCRVAGRSGQGRPGREGLPGSEVSCHRLWTDLIASRRLSCLIRALVVDAGATQPLGRRGGCSLSVTQVRFSY